MSLRLSGALLGALVLLLASSNPCRAGLYVGSGTNSAANHALAASADFSLSGSTLTIVLKNTSTQTYGTNKAVPSSVLTALLIEINPTPNPFTLVSAYASGLVNYTGASNPNLAVSGTKKDPIGTLGGWQLKPSAGLGTAGFGIFNGDIVNQGPGQGYNFGVINAGYNPGDGNKPVNQTPLVRDTLTFTVTVGPGFSLEHVKSVKFQYGTSLSEPSFFGVLQPTGGPPGGEDPSGGPDDPSGGPDDPGAAPVPEPSTLAMALGSVAMLGAARVIRRRRAAGAVS